MAKFSADSMPFVDPNLDEIDKMHSASDDELLVDLIYPYLPPSITDERPPKVIEMKHADGRSERILDMGGDEVLIALTKASGVLNRHMYS